MFYKDGFVYGGEPQKTIKVIEIKVLPDRILLLKFNNGEQRVFDSTILNGPVFEVLKDDLVFANPVLDHGIVTWCDGEVDCAPEYMYNHSYEYMQEPVMQ